MKILHQPNKPDDGWWIGKRHRCDMCETGVELEKGDTVTVNAGRGITFDCPTCGMPCYVPITEPVFKQSIFDRAMQTAAKLT